jgi:threonylcarbamoyladenosine tRNA methylthiotransferase MtaB
MSTINYQLSTKKACVHTLGCRLNQSESAILEEKLREDGYTLVPFGEPADLAIVNTCTVTNEADTKSRKLVRQFIRNNPGAYTAVIGCYAQMGAGTLAAIPGVDLIIGNQEKMNVLDYVKAGKNEKALIVRDRIDRDDFSIDFGGEDSPLSRRANLKVQDGCDFMCTFCLIPFARGRARAREWDNLLSEARSLVVRGAKEIFLTGVNIGTYDLEGRNILHIVDALNTIDGLHRIRISSIEPTTIPLELFDRMNDPDHALLPYLHIPMQAGSNDILTAMRRKYTREEFLDFIFQAHEAVPGIGIGTDILVGFPGETEENFQDTCDTLWKSPLFYAHVFKYSERAGTASVRIPDKVPGPVINERGARLRKLSAEKTRMFCEHQIGETHEVLFEQAQDGYWTGYAQNYTRVAAKSDLDLENQIGNVTLEEVSGDLIIGNLLPDSTRLPG